MDKTVVITGGNAGIGKATAHGIAKQGARLVLACRNQKTAQAACQEIRRDTGNENVSVMALDLSSLDSIRAFASELRKEHQRIDVLVNNAGVFPSKLEKTAEGFEAQFGVNYLGHFLLTNLLLDQLRRSPSARIVHVSSMMHRLGRIDFGNFKGEKRYRAFNAYTQSKLANILFSNELSRRLAGEKITSNALHPGAVVTGLYESLPGPVLRAMQRVMDSPEKGARTSIHLALSPEVEGVSGKYFVGCKMRGTSRLARNEQLASRLWRVSERFCGLGDQIRDEARQR